MPQVYIICEADIIALAISPVLQGTDIIVKKSLLYGMQKDFFVACSHSRFKSLTSIIIPHLEGGAVLVYTNSIKYNSISQILLFAK